MRKALWWPLLSVFVVLDSLLFSSNAMKLFGGVWLPMMVGISLLTLMLTWKKGREKMHQNLAGDQPPLKAFMEGLEQYPPTRVEGTAVFMSMIYNTVPPALLHKPKHKQVLHEQALFLPVESAEVTYVTLD